MYIVVTNKGFLTTKMKPEETDTIILEVPEEECSDIIHGKGQKTKINEENYKKYPNINRGSIK